MGITIEASGLFGIQTNDSTADNSLNIAIGELPFEDKPNLLANIGFNETPPETGASLNSPLKFVENSIAETLNPAVNNISANISTDKHFIESLVLSRDLVNNGSANISTEKPANLLNKPVESVLNKNQRDLPNSLVLTDKLNGKAAQIYSANDENLPVLRENPARFAPSFAPPLEKLNLEKINRNPEITNQNSEITNTMKIQTNLDGNNSLNADSGQSANFKGVNLRLTTNEIIDNKTPNLQTEITDNKAPNLPTEIIDSETPKLQTNVNLREKLLLPNDINNGGNRTANFAQANLFDGGNVRTAALQANAGQTTNAKFDYNQIAGVKNNPNVTPEFLRGVEAMAGRLGTRPELILAAMSFETGGTFSPKITNNIGATGLIQFLPSTARGLGTTTDALRQMSATEQLQFVEKYLAPFKGKLNSQEAVYTSILSGSPKQDPNAVLFTKGTKAYEQNPLDWNKDGKITASEATTPVTARMFGGVSKVQQRLVDLGFVPADKAKKFVDGQWGSNTSNVLSDFQKSRGLPATGALDEATGRSLFNQGAATQPPATTTQPNPPPGLPINPNPQQPVQTNNTPLPKSNLQRGQHNAEVAQLQNILVKLGHLSQDEMNTGIGTFGPRTERAVHDFQKANNLPPTGRFDNTTRDAMNTIIGGIGRHKNGNGNIVKGLQDKLVNLGYMTRAEVNTGYGIFGPKTEAALKNFQAKNNIRQTGILGATTYKALQSANANGTNTTGNNGALVATNGRYYNVNSGILVTDSLKPKLESVAIQNLHKLLLENP